MASATFETSAIFPVSIQYMHVHCIIWPIWGIFLHDSVFRSIFLRFGTRIPKKNLLPLLV